MKNIIKILRYSSMHGFQRTVVKTFGRSRWHFNLVPFLNPRKFFKNKKEKKIAIIGCGQFAYSTVAFFIVKRFGPIFKYCADIDSKQALSFAKAFKVPYYQTIENNDLSFIENIDLAYITSNHASHTPYACFFLKKNIDVYIEKPIAVSQEQLRLLIDTYKDSKANIYFGYNRPFSQAITELKKHMGKGPLSLSCVIIGHFIPSDHWYRNPKEGTRVCGNLGHWLDLAIHLLMYRGEFEPSELNISITYSHPEVNDDDISLSISTIKNDLINIVLTSREEPFEGINETIIFQQQGLFAKIDDFRKAEFNIRHKKIKRTYKPKDVGHKNAIMQPFSTNERNIDEVFLSTDLMLHITDMVRKRKTNALYWFDITSKKLRCN